MKSAITKYLYEFILLFAAVTASFWVENYREYQNEKDTMKKQLEGLITEFNLVNDSVRSMDYEAYFLEFNHLCSLIRNDDTFSLNDSTFGTFASQKFLVKSDFLDDLYSSSSITERSEYRHIKNDTLASFFYRLNDYQLENSRLIDWAFEYDEEMTEILEEYDLHGKSFPGSMPDSLFQKSKVFLSGISSYEEEENRWQEFSKDPRLKSLLGKMQALHFNAYFLHGETVEDFKSHLNAIQREIEGM